jgi:hypothetical protein
MDTKTTTTPRNRHLAIKLATAAAIAALAMKIHAEVNINFGSTPFGTNLQSDGSAMDSSFTFELGTFTGGFVPTAGNTDQWATNWTPVVDSGGTPLPDAITSYGTIPFGSSSSFEGFNSEIALDHNTSPIDIGAQGYVWGYNTLAGDGEWILLTNTDPSDKWTFGDASGITFSEAWTVGSADEAIVGAINFTDGGAAIAMQTANVSLPPAVPEPSTTIVLAATAFAFAFRRRRASC